MHFSSFLFLLPAVIAAPAAVWSRAAKPVYWLLAGDSTTAPNGGWGDAFLANTVAAGSSGHNYGHSGATTASFRATGEWATLLKDVQTHKKNYAVYVTIQVCEDCRVIATNHLIKQKFGHNDQKATSGVTLADYRTNLGNFVDQVVAAGGTPILVTPLTRRAFDSKTKKVIENLSEQRKITIAVATAKKADYIDLNEASTNYVNAIGQKAANSYNLSPKDSTHLNPTGALVFSRLVSDLLVQKYPTIFVPVTKKDASLTALIDAGKPYM